MKYTIGIKKEMTQIFDNNGDIVPVTVVDISNVKVVGLKTKEKDGYDAVVLGKDKKKKANKAELTKYTKVGYAPKKAAEFKTEEKLEVGSDVDFDLEAGSKVDIVGITKGKGFAGVVKRWGFKGGPRTHGQSDRLRAPGSIGSGTTPGRVYKGKKMGGHMGVDKITVQNLMIAKIDKENGLLLIKGALPGGKNSYLLIKPTNK